MTRILFLCLCLSACASFPAVNAAFDPDAQTPGLLPTADLPATARAAASDPLASRTASLQARAAALRAR